MIYLVLRKQDGRFPLLNNEGNLEFLEAENKPQAVGWRDFVSIILRNKYGFSKELVEGIKIVEPLYTSGENVFVYVELGIYRLYAYLPFFSVSFPIVQSKFSLHKMVKEHLPDIKMNLEMLGLWEIKKKQNGK